MCQYQPSILTAEGTKRSFAFSGESSTRTSQMRSRRPGDIVPWPSVCRYGSSPKSLITSHCSRVIRTERSVPLNAWAIRAANFDGILMQLEKSPKSPRTFSAVTCPSVGWSKSAMNQDVCSRRPEFEYPRKRNLLPPISSPSFKIPPKRCSMSERPSTYEVTPLGEFMILKRLHT